MDIKKNADMPWIILISWKFQKETSREKAF